MAPVPSGFDLEPQNREVSQAAYKRFTSLRERRLGLTPLEAWVAKEAAFKALSAQYPIKTITEVQLFKPRKLRPKKILEFSFKYNKNNSLRSNGRGFLMTYDRFLLGFASISP